MALERCPDKVCEGGSSYWAVTQMCGQDKLWDKPDPRVLLSYDDSFCYCECAAGKKYCYSPNCVSNMVAVMNQCTVQQLQYQQFVSVQGGDPDPCECPCPHMECYFCDDPTVAEYVRTNCDESGWWPGYPMVLSAGGGQMCTCLCPDDAAKTMAAAVPEGRVRLEHLGVEDSVLVAGPDLAWRPAPVVARTTSSYLAPVPAVKVRVGDRGATFMADQFILGVDGRLHSALTLTLGESVRGADGSEMVLDEVKHLEMYAAPLPFVAVSFDPPGDSLQDRLLDINGFVVADYSIQLFWTMDLLDRSLVHLGGGGA